MHITSPPRRPPRKTEITIYRRSEKRFPCNFSPLPIAHICRIPGNNAKIYYANAEQRLLQPFADDWREWRGKRRSRNKIRRRSEKLSGNPCDNKGSRTREAKKRKNGKIMKKFVHYIIAKFSRLAEEAARARVPLPLSSLRIAA